MLHRPVLIAVIPLLAGFVVATRSDAGQVQAPRGRVLINQGMAFVPAKDRQVFGDGDRLLLLPGSQVGLEFADGCRQTIRGPHIVQAGSDPTCVGPATVLPVPITAADAGPVAKLMGLDGQPWWFSSRGLGRVEEEDFFDSLGP